MKIYISADIEGLAGIASWSETDKSHGDYGDFSKEMSLEVRAACEGALEAGAQELFVRDAHDSARNIDINSLPEEAILQRGWSCDPLCMVSGIDQGYDGAVFIGYHSRAGSNRSPLAHSMDTDLIYIKINGKEVSEFVINAYAAAYYEVPVLFVSGDMGLIDEIKEYTTNIQALGVKEGIGDSVVSLHPNKVIKEIKEGVKAAMKGDLKASILELPESFKVEVGYRKHQRAYKSSFYPGAELKTPHSVEFSTKDYYEVLRFIHFTC